MRTIKLEVKMVAENGKEEAEAKLGRNSVVIGAVGGFLVRTCLHCWKPGV